MANQCVSPGGLASPEASVFAAHFPANIIRRSHPVESSDRLRTNLQSLSIRFRLGEYPGRYNSSILREAARACTTAHFWYHALSSPSVIGSPTPAAATARRSAHTDSALM